VQYSSPRVILPSRICKTIAKYSGGNAMPVSFDRPQ
jgi:hypothetical protein